ncbi:MAG TPA: hypothetical protein PLH61_13485, partial [Bacteroidia bacterium]|nr:hypothetical protein [Bacteroidia bacterium]
ASANQTFPAISKAIANETIYFWITMDVASSVTSGHTITASVLNSSHLTASVTLSGSALASGTQTIYDCKPEAPVFYNFGSEDFILFNNAAFYMEEPRFRLSSTHTSAINMFYIEINTASDFTGTSYCQSFPGTYISETEYDFLCDGLSSSLPTTENVTYYVRAKASDNGGSTWSTWSTGTYSFTFTSSTIPEWHQTTTAQFFTNTLLDCESSSNKVLMPTTVMSTQKVSSDNDDGYELQGSTVWITGGPNNRLGYRLEGINRNCIAGIRFSSVPIPKNAIITSSSLSLCSYETKSATVNVKIYGIDEDNTSNFNTTTQEPSDKAKTSASSDWTLQNPWTVDNWYTSSSINSSVQEIVDRAGWSSGNAMGFIFTNNGSGDNKQFVDYWEGANLAPKLDISYISPSATIISTPVDFQSFLGADDWDEIEFNHNTTGGDIRYRVYYEVMGTPTIIPDVDLTGNSTGFTNSPIDISMLDPASYPRIYIHATFSPETASPEIYDWTVKARGGTLPVELKT